jgi:hypothetical protein
MPADAPSISVRLRRTTTESAHVSVPVSEETTRADGDGEDRKLDVEKIMQAALEIGTTESIEWEQEGEPQIELHPIQAPLNSDSVE